MPSILMSGLLTAALAAPAAPTAAADDAEMWKETTLELLEVLVAKGVLTRAQAEALLERARARAASRAAPPVEEGDVRVTHVPEIVQDRLRDRVRSEVLAELKAEQWSRAGAPAEDSARVSFSGEVLLRSQTDFFGRSNSTSILDLQAINEAGRLNIPGATLHTDPADPSRPRDDRYRLRVRARVAMDARVSDRLSAGVRFTTGAGDEPIVTVQTAGTAFGRYDVTLDRVFLRYGEADWLELLGGRIPNPLFSTELVWFQELGFEGIAATLRQPAGEPWRAFGTLGAFPLEEGGSNGRNKWLYAGQAGLDWEAAAGARARIAATYYAYTNVTGVRNPSVGNTNVNDFTAPRAISKGNTVFNIADTSVNVDAARFALASEYRLVNLTGSVDLPARGQQRLVLTGDLVRNIGFDAAAAAARVGAPVTARTTGYLARLGYGQPQLGERGQWLANFGYRYIGGDAVVAAFNDPFFHLGGTDTKGYDVSFAYALEKATTVQVRWTSASSIAGPRLDIDTLLVDVNTRF